MKLSRRVFVFAIAAPTVAVAISALLLPRDAIATPGNLPTDLQSPTAAALQPVPPNGGDFVPRLNEDQAQQVVTAAQQADAARRAALAPTPRDGLPMVRSVYTSPSQHHMSDRVGFLTFWRENGALLIFGYPVTEELVENGKIVQYFERAKLEYDPAVNQVQIALLGRELTAGRDFGVVDASAGELFYPETGHTLSGKFRQFWEKRGGLPVFGFPISQPFEETSTIDGQVRIVQYFERAKFEYFPEQLGGFYQSQVQAYGLRLAALREVQLADLGRQAALRNKVYNQAVSQFSGAPEWSDKNYARRIEVNLSSQTLTAYEDDLPVFHAPVATGRDGFNTPTGSYAIYDKLTMQDMFGSMGGESWYVPSIPWVQYVVGGVALHGTWWHDQWGTGVRMSHGCINLNIDDAQWLYEWADVGTPVNISY